MTTLSRSKPRLWRSRPALFIALALALLALPLAGLFLQSDINADGQAGATPPGRADLWRQVREGVAGYSAVKGPGADVLIQGSGQNWRQIRNGPVAAYGAWLLAATVFALGSFFLLRGKVRLVKGPSGRKLPRWSLEERLLHWYTALLFLTLSFTGLSLLYGRAALIPLVGRESFAAWAEWAKLLHNYLGPLFIVGLMLMLVAWVRDNLPDRSDLLWFKAFGGLIGSRHPSAGRMNGGEKAWFWLVVFAGAAVSASGLILDFPNFSQGRGTMQITHLIHAASALVLMAGALGHIYIGTIGTEGAFEGMITGKVDEAWAEQHHDLWYHESMKQPEGENLPRPPEIARSELPSRGSTPGNRPAS